MIKLLTHRHLLSIKIIKHHPSSPCYLVLQQIQFIVVSVLIDFPFLATLYSKQFHVQGNKQYFYTSVAIIGFFFFWENVNKLILVQFLFLDSLQMCSCIDCFMLPWSNKPGQLCNRHQQFTHDNPTL